MSDTDDPRSLGRSVDPMIKSARARATKLAEMFVRAGWTRNPMLARWETPDGRCFVTDELCNTACQDGPEAEMALSVIVDALKRTSRKAG